MYSERRYDDTNTGANQPAEPLEPLPEWLAHTLDIIFINLMKQPPSPPAKRAAARFLQGLEIDRIPVPLTSTDDSSVRFYWTRDGRQLWFRVEGPVTYWASRTGGVGPVEEGSFLTERPAQARELIARVFGEAERGFTPDVLDRLRADEESRVVR